MAVNYFRSVIALFFTIAVYYSYSNYESAKVTRTVAIPTDKPVLKCKAYKPIKTGFKSFDWVRIDLKPAVVITNATRFRSQYEFNHPNPDFTIYFSNNNEAYPLHEDVHVANLNSFSPSFYPRKADTIFIKESKYSTNSIKFTNFRLCEYLNPTVKPQVVTPPVVKPPVVPPTSKPSTPDVPKEPITVNIDIDIEINIIVIEESQDPNDEKLPVVNNKSDNRGIKEEPVKDTYNLSHRLSIMGSILLVLCLV